MTHFDPHSYLSYDFIADLYDTHRGENITIKLNDLGAALCAATQHTFDVKFDIAVRAEETPVQFWSKMHYLIQANLVDGELNITDSTTGETSLWVSPDALFSLRPPHFMEFDEIVNIPVPEWVMALYDLKPETGEIIIPLHVRVELIEDTLNTIEFDYQLELSADMAAKHSNPVAHLWDEVVRDICSQYENDTLHLLSKSQCLHGIEIESITPIV